eukprot:COSAG01_NODE_636_length_14635_cov_18.612617_5_plen_249_part_00
MKHIEQAFVLNKKIKKQDNQKKQTFLAQFKNLYEQSANPVSEAVMRSVQKLKNHAKQKNSRVKRQDKNFILRLVKQCRMKPVNYSARAIAHLIRLKRDPKPEIQNHATEALEILFSQPLVLTKKAEARAIRAVSRCSKALETDDLDRQFKMLRHLNWLKRSNAATVRQAAINALQWFNQRHHVTCEEALENALIDIERLRISVLSKQSGAIDQFKSLMDYIDSVSPTVRMEAENAVEECLSQTVRARA